jgi:hypothetical protein
MPTDRLMRASDKDREGIATELRDAYATGLLSLQEFFDRIEASFAARTQGELRDLTADLPGPAAGPLPADNVAVQLAARLAARRRHARKAVACLLVLVAGIAGRLLPSAVWLVAVVVLAALLVLSWPASGPGR